MPNDIEALKARLRSMPTCSCAGDGTESPNLYEQAAAALDALTARIQELEGALREAENRIVALYDGIAPQAHYEDLGIEGDRSGNRHADNDEVVQRIRAALNGGDGNG